MFSVLKVQTLQKDTGTASYVSDRPQKFVMVSSCSYHLILLEVTEEQGGGKRGASRYANFGKAFKEAVGKEFEPLDVSFRLG